MNLEEVHVYSVVNQKSPRGFLHASLQFVHFQNLIWFVILDTYKFNG